MVYLQKIPQILEHMCRVFTADIWAS